MEKIKQMQKDYMETDEINDLECDSEIDNDTHSNASSDEDLNNNQTFDFNRFALLLENE